MSAHDTLPDVIVRSGFLHLFRFYDFADEIDLTKVEEIARSQGESTQRVRLAHAQPKSIAFEVPPVELRWGRVELPLEGESKTFEVICRVYDFGVVSIALRLASVNLSWSDYTRILNQMAHCAVDDDVWLQSWDSLRSRVSQFLMPALCTPTVAGVEEDYAVAEVKAFASPLVVDEVLRQLDLVPVLTGERRALSPAARQDLLKNRFSYYTDDMVALTWDRAFVYEPSNDASVMDVLQLANAQLAEMRSYDQRLDRELPEMHAKIAAAHSGLISFRRHDYSELARSLYTLVSEVVKVRERLENALQVTEDVYLARVHASAMRLFRVHEFQSAVNRKLDIVRNAYTALYNEAATRRSHQLEFAIILLFIVDILLMLLGGK